MDQDPSLTGNLMIEHLVGANVDLIKKNMQKLDVWLLLIY